MRGHTDYGFCSSFNFNSNYIATSNQDLSTFIWDLRKEHTPVKILKSYTSAVYANAFSPDGKYLFCPETIDTVKIYDFS